MMTVLLTAPDPRLIGELQRDMPALDARVISSQPPGTRFEGPLFCFIDWLLPDISGLEMVRRLRECEATKHGHITMILEGTDPDDRRRALRAGADDYLVGPLDPAKLAERLNGYAGTVRVAQASSGLRHGELTAEPSAHQIRYRGAPVPLRPNEFRLLVHFIGNPDRLFSRHELIAEAGKEGEALDERTVDVWIGRLRRALRAHGVPNPLRTVRSLGYVLDSLPG